MLYFTVQILIYIIISLFLSTCDTFYLRPTILRKVSLQMNNVPKEPVLKKEGIIPSRSHRIAKVGNVPVLPSGNLKIIESTHELTYVKISVILIRVQLVVKNLLKLGFWIMDLSKLK